MPQESLQKEKLAGANLEAPFGYSQTGAWADGFGGDLFEFMKRQRRPRALSLFSGGGGLDIGFYDCGFEIVEKVEIEKNFCNTLAANTGPDKYFQEDGPVSCIDISSYSPCHKDIDFIIGGPPCQSFSAAGARASGVAGTRDLRGNLFREYVRLVDHVKPVGFLFENVYRIVGANKGKDWAQIIAAFKDVGYELRHRILDSADYGVAQHRERLIIVGVRKDVSSKLDFLFPRPTHGPDSRSGLPHFGAEMALQGLENSANKQGINGKFGPLLNQIPPGLNYSFFTEKMGHPNPIFAWRSKFSDFLYKADPERPVRTIKAQGGQYTGPFHWENRPFTVEELKRLQSFPDSYHFYGGRSESIKQIGNSVPPQFARILACAVAEQIFGLELPLDLDYLQPEAPLSFRSRRRNLTGHYRDVAGAAISRLGQTNLRFDLKTYKAKLGENLAWLTDVPGGYKIRESRKNNQLTISLGEGDDFVVEIYPIKKWDLPVASLVLKTGTISDQAILMLWKALEHCLARNNLKADLVQLSGYYQYPCAFSCRVTLAKSDEFYAVLKKIIEGQMVGVEATVADFSKGFDVPEASIKPFLHRLKKMGYEVRSSSTNQAIPEGRFLIPYCFPTLNERSVQRGKNLS